MSTASEQDLSRFNFPGGFPSSKDLAPSIVFLIAYVVATPVLIWRIYKKEYRTICLIRPGLFLLARYVMLVLRAIMSKNSYGENELIAELVVVSIGTLFLVEPMTTLWKRNVALAVKMDVAPNWVRKVALILKLGVLAAIGTALASSANISDAIDNPDDLSTVMDLKKASAIITEVVIIVTLLAAILTHQRFGLAIRNTLYIVGCCLCLTVISTYRLVQTYSTDPSDSVRKPVVFWICQMVFEFIVFIALIAIPIPEWFPSEKSQQKQDDVEVGDLDVRGKPSYPGQYNSPSQTRGYSQSVRNSTRIPSS